MILLNQKFVEKQNIHTVSKSIPTDTQKLQKKGEATRIYPLK